jgi:uncharacterized RmlC-like cupin family protein
MTSPHAPKSRLSARPSTLKGATMSDTATTERPVTCAQLRAGEPFVGKQDFSYAATISAETARASAIHMQLLTIPPGARAKAHKHEAHETANTSTYPTPDFCSGNVHFDGDYRKECLGFAGDNILLGTRRPDKPARLDNSPDMELQNSGGLRCQFIDRSRGDDTAGNVGKIHPIVGVRLFSYDAQIDRLGQMDRPSPVSSGVPKISRSVPAPTLPGSAVSPA